MVIMRTYLSYTCLLSKLLLYWYENKWQTDRPIDRQTCFNITSDILMLLQFKAKVVCSLERKKNPTVTQQTESKSKQMLMNYSKMLNKYACMHYIKQICTYAPSSE